MLDSPEVLAAYISGGATIIATLLAAIAASIIGKNFAGREKLKSDLEDAKKDIEYLLAVELRHCELHREHGKGSNKLRARRDVEKNRHLKFSKRFYPSARKNET